MKKIYTTISLCLLLCWAVTGNLSAQSPNDNCVNAITIVCGQTITGNTTGNTPDANPCGGATSPGVWYNITPVSTGTMTISLCGSAYDTRLSIYTGACPGVMVPGACNDDFCGLQSQLTIPVVGGTLYRILVNGFVSNFGTFTLTATCTVGTFDPCTSILPAAPCAVTNTTVAAPGTGAFALPPFTPQGRENIYTFTPTVTGVYTITQISTTSSNWVDYFFKASSSGCNGTGWTFIQDLLGNNVTSTGFTLTAFTQYYIMLDAENTGGHTTNWRINCPGGGGPANDLCANAIPLACNSSVNGTNVGATVDPVGVCGSANGTVNGVWYTIVGNGGQITLSTCTGTTYDSQITVYTGACGALTCLTGNDDACGLQSSVQFLSTLGVTYRVAVYGFASQTGTFTLTAVCSAPCAPPSNDHCSTPGGGNVIIAPGGANVFTGNSVCATSTNDGAFSAYPTVWHQFTATGCASTTTVSYCGNVNWQNVWLNLATNCTGTGPTTFTPAGTFAACAGVNQSYVVTFTNLAAGTYWVAVLGQGNDPGFVVIPGPYSVTVSRAACPTPPGNDTPCPAMAGNPLYFINPLTTTFQTRSYNLTNATADPGEISPGIGTITYGGGPAPGGSCNAINGWCNFETLVQNSVWYAFIGPASGNVEIEALGGDTQLAVYSAGTNCLDYTEFTEIGANDDALPGFQARLGDVCIGFLVTPNQPAFIQVDGFAHANVIGTLRIRDAGPPIGAAVNDVCAGATTITLGTPVNGTTNCQNIEPYPACGTGSNATSRSVWYKFTGNGNRVNLGTCPAVGGSATFDTQIRVFRGACNALICVAGNDDACGLQSQVGFCTTPGTQYWIVVDGFGAAQGDFTLGSTQTPGPTPTLVPTVYNCGFNVSCAGANNGSITAIPPPAPGQLRITVQGTGFLDETEWQLRNAANNIIASGGPFAFGSTNIVLFTPTINDYPVTFTINTMGFFNDNIANYNVTCVPTNTTLVAGTLQGGQTFTSGPLLCSGAGAFTYSWSPGNQTTPTINNLSPGTYCATVTDANGCQGTTCITLVGPQPVVATGVVTTYNCGYNVTCNGATDGGVDVSVSGGCAPYSYMWSNSSTGQDLSGVGAGDYSVSVTDANGCTTTASFTLTQPDALESSGTMSTYDCGFNVSCFGASDGSIDLSVTGGCAPYSYSWSNSATTQDVSGLSAGTYSVSIVDANNCSSSATFTLTEPAPVTVNAGPNQLVYYGYGSNCATLTATGAAGGCGPNYTYSWSPGGATTASITVCPTVSTDYTVTITDQNGCTGSDVVRVCVIDVHCGHNGNKVIVCHFPGGNPSNAHNICISSNAVATHLTGHGDHLGPCGSNIPCDNTFKAVDPSAAMGVESRLTAYPNPFNDATTVEFTVEEDQNVNVEVFSLTGVKVATLFDGIAESATTYKLNFRPETAASGIYIARMTTSTGIVKTEKLILQK